MKNWIENSPAGIKAKASLFGTSIASSRPSLLRPVIAGCAFGAYTDSVAVAIGTVAGLSYIGSAIAAAGSGARVDLIENNAG